MTRVSDFFLLLGYLVFLLLAVLAWFSPWLPIRETPPAKPRLRIRHLMILVLACALFLAWVRAVLEDATQTLWRLSWR
jgi:hypothetical protein